MHTIRLIDITDQYDHQGVPSLLFDIYVSELQRYVGRCEFRNESGRDLLYYGNIGYVIYPPYRGHNFAYRACLKLFDILRHHEKGLQEVIITCNPDNDASKHIIEKLGGRFINHVMIDADHELQDIGETSKYVYKLKLYE